MRTGEVLNQVPGDDLVSHACLEVVDLNDKAQPRRVDQKCLRSLGGDDADVMDPDCELVAPRGDGTLDVDPVGLVDKECDTSFCISAGGGQRRPLHPGVVRSRYFILGAVLALHATPRTCTEWGSTMRWQCARKGSVNRLCPAAVFIRRGHYGEQRFDVEVALKGQSEGQVGSDVVDVPAPLPLTIEVPRADQVGHDALGGALGDVEKVREISNANSWVTGDQEERVAVIREQPEVRDGAQGGRRRSSVVGAQLYSGAEYMFHDLRDS